MTTIQATPALEQSKKVALTIAIVTSVCALIAGMIVSPGMISISPDHCGTRIALVFPLLLALIPHVDILVRLRREKPQKGVMLALMMGAAGLVLALLAMTPLFRNAWILDLRLPIYVAVAQAAVVISGGWAYSFLRRKSGERPPLTWAGGTLLGYSAFILILGLIANPTLDNPGRRFYSNQARAATFVRQVPLFELVFFRASGGDSPNLAMLATARVEGMPEALPASTRELLTGLEDQGYIYAYTPGPLDESGQIRAYTIAARPRIHAITGCLSLFADESGVVRGTTEDRAATPQDPPLGG